MANTTGITRRIDELGRVVIPKELRDNMDLPEGTPMEFLLNGGDIILRKFVPLDMEKLTASIQLEALTSKLNEADAEVILKAVELLKRS